MSTAVITKSLKSGQTLEVMIGKGNRPEVLIDGETACAGLPEELRKPQGDVTHHIGRKVGFTADETAAIMAAYRAANPPTLREQRGALVNELRGLQDNQDADYERGHESDGSAAHAAARKWDAKIEAARQAVADFDAAHPEVMEEVAAEKAERVQRNRWQ